MPKLSIISTLVEAFWLGWSHRRLILALAVIGAIPTMLMTLVLLQLAPLPPPTTTPPDTAKLAAQAAQMATNALLIGACTLVSVAFIFVVTALTTTSLLGVLKTEPSPADLWPTIKQNIRAYTWPFIIVQILLTIVACVVMIPFTMIISIFGFSTMKPGSQDPFSHGYFIEFMVMLMGILYLIFVKYALVNPVLVLENKRPIAALEKSWQMTRGFFWYVLGCYVFLGTAEYAIDALFQHFETPTSFNVANAAQMLLASVIEFYWILLAWCMYHRIKATEKPPAFPV